MEIKRVEEEDIDDVLELFCVSDPRHIRSRRYYYWRNWESPFGRAYSFLLKVNGKPVAHYSVLPMEIYYRGKTVKIGYGQQAVVHPKRRNLKYIYILMNEIVNRLKEEKIGFIIAFPNDDFYLVKEKIMKWTLVSRTTAKTYIIEDILNTNIFSGVSSKDNNANVQKIYNVNSHLHILKEQSLDDNIIVFKSDWKYIDWRYIKNPESFYFIFLHRSHDKWQENVIFDGIAVLKPYFDRESRELTGHILQLEAENVNSQLELIYHSLRYMKDELGVRKLIQWDFGSSLIRDFLKKFDYIEERYHVNFLIKGVTLEDEEKLKEFLDESRWFIDMHISDVY